MTPLNSPICNGCSSVFVTGIMLGFHIKGFQQLGMSGIARCLHPKNNRAWGIKRHFNEGTSPVWCPKRSRHDIDSRQTPGEGS